MDPTATLVYSDYVQKLYKMKILVIGSGQDIDGRGMSPVIDESGYYGCVARINKTYGAINDVGTRCDILFTRWSMWAEPAFGFIDENTRENLKELVILNQNVGYSITERGILIQETGCENLSAGIQAVHWLLNRGCEHVDLIGFGFDSKTKSFSTEKRYCQNSKNFTPGQLDENPHYDFMKERQWLMKQPSVNFI